MEGYAGIDYGMGKANIDHDTGIRYGVISQHEVLQAWADSSEADYPTLLDTNDFECSKCREPYFPTEEDNWGDYVICKECGEEFELDGDDLEPYGFILDDGEYKASCGQDGGIFITLSPFYTECMFCSPCAPGAGYLMSPVKDGVKAYCFGHDWFDEGRAPYPVYQVDTGELVEPTKEESHES